MDKLFSKVYSLEPYPEPSRDDVFNICSKQNELRGEMQNLLVIELIQQGADVNTKDHKGRTALDYSLNHPLSEDNRYAPHISTAPSTILTLIAEGADYSIEKFEHALSNVSYKQKLLEVFKDYFSAPKEICNEITTVIPSFSTPSTGTIGTIITEYASSK